MTEIKSAEWFATAPRMCYTMEKSKGGIPMAFKYTTYFIFLFLLPAAVLVITSPVVFKAVKLLFQLIRDRDFSGNEQRIFLAVLVVVLCVVPQVIYLSHGGIFLAAERADDTVELSGIVESITEPSSRFPGLRADSYKGADVVIDGTRCFMLTAQGLEVGDEVSVSYLPKSGVVMEYRETGE